MSFIGNEQRRRRPVWPISAALLITSVFFLTQTVPVYSESPPPSIICYSVITLESDQDLKRYAALYDTTVEQILRDNPEATLHKGETLTIREDQNKQENVISRGSSTSWAWPVIGSITSEYGWRDGDFHHGLDIATPSGTVVKAARTGKVVKAGWLGVYGLAILIDHGNGIQTLYAHNSKLMVNFGTTVQSGQKIALSGNTGRTTGPHVHFEIRLNGKTVDPTPYLTRTKIAFDVKNYFKTLINELIAMF